MAATRKPLDLPKVVLQPHDDGTYDCNIRFVNHKHTLFQQVPAEDDTKQAIINIVKAYKIKSFELIIVGKQKTGGQEMTPTTFKGIKSLSYRNLVKQLEL